MELLEKTSTQVYKRCRICGEEKPLANFSHEERMRGGYRNECRKCVYLMYIKPYRQSEKGRKSQSRENKRYRDSPTHIMAAYRFRATSHCKEYMREYSKRWRLSSA